MTTHNYLSPDLSQMRKVDRKEYCQTIRALKKTLPTGEALLQGPCRTNPDFEVVYQMLSKRLEAVIDGTRYFQPGGDNEFYLPIRSVKPKRGTRVQIINGGKGVQECNGLEGIVVHINIPHMHSNVSGCKGSDVFVAVGDLDTLDGRYGYVLQPQSTIHFTGTIWMLGPEYELTTVPGHVKIEESV